MVLAGTAIGAFSSGPAIVGLGQSLARGTVISIILVLFVLPQILISGDRIISATTFEAYRPVRTREEKGDIFLNGTIRGQVNGTLIGRYVGVIRGEADVAFVSGDMETISPELIARLGQVIDEDKEKQKEEKKAPEIKQKGGDEV